MSGKCLGERSPWHEAEHPEITMDNLGPWHEPFPGPGSPPGLLAPPLLFSPAQSTQHPTPGLVSDGQPMKELQLQR